MQLKVTRSQQKKGMMSKNVVFLLTARLHLTEEEKFAVDEYKLGDIVIYNSEQSRNTWMDIKVVPARWVD